MESDEEQWHDCLKILPYRDYLGRIVWWPRYTERRVINGKVQYRERQETFEEWGDRQW
jgi:hypothetical protein